MSEEILINVTPPETRVAVVENGVVQEIIVERTAKRGLVGNIYKGKVCRVLPGMQAAFVDAGLERAAAAERAGIPRSAIHTDPGIGFGKTLEHNRELFRNLPRFCGSGFPVLVGVSRKSMLGMITGRPVDERLAGSLAAAVLAAQAGAASRHRRSTRRLIPRELRTALRTFARRRRPGSAGR